MSAGDLTSPLSVKQAAEADAMPERRGAFMVVYMTIADTGWIEPYFAHVPQLLAEYGAVPVAASRTIRRIEGQMPVPDRIAAFAFPSVEAIDRFMADPRYQPHRSARERGADSDIFVFENAVTGRKLV